MEELVRRGLTLPIRTPSNWQSDPAGYLRHVLKTDPWPVQERIAEAVRDCRRVAVRSCHHSGKTFAMAGLAHWFATAHNPALVITTAPTLRQVRDLLWYEIAQHHVRSGAAGKLGGLSLEFSPTQRILGFTTNEPERFQGWHCLSEDHEILTKRGWVGIDEITKEDWVLSAHVTQQEARWMPIFEIYRYPYEGDLFTYETANVSFAVTNEHRFPVRGQEDMPRWRLERLCDLPALSFLRRVVEWTGKAFEVPEPFAAYGWSPEQFAEFLGFWIGDGGLRMHTKTGRFYEVLLYQVRPDGGCSRGLLPNVKVQTGRDHVVFCNRACAEWLAENVGRYGAERRIPRFVLDAPPKALEAFCEGFWRAEGSYVKGEKRGVYNSNAALMGQVQEILIKLGRPSTLGVNRKSGSSKQAKGRNFEMRRDCLRLYWNHSPADHSLLRKNIKPEPYSGRVWCISTPWQTFYTRRNGKVFLSGNSENILVLVDEASGVEEPIYEAIEGCLTGPNAHLALIGNPNSPMGTFYEAFRSPLYEKFHISAFDVPERLLPASWAEERRIEWGEESPAYQVRVLGNFPPQGENALVSMAWVQAAMEREGNEAGPVEMGVDIARYGSDESVCYVRRGQRVVSCECWRGHDTMASAGRIAALAREYAPELIKVDDIGVGGGVVDRLSEEGLPVQGVNVGLAASDPENYFNLRTELFQGLADRFKDGEIALPKDDLLLDQLTQLRFTFTPKGQKKLESKEDMRKRRGSARGWQSPDRADALMLCFAVVGGHWSGGAVAGGERDSGMSLGWG